MQHSKPGTWDNQVKETPTYWANNVPQEAITSPLLQTTTDPIVLSVIQKLNNRSLVGISKYNTTLKSNNTDNFLLHLQEELLDAANYIEKLLQDGNQS